MSKVVDLVVKSTGIDVSKVNVVIELLEGGNTIPFIARYRKEVTGGLDEVALFDIQKHYDLAVKLIDRRAFILHTLESKEKLTSDLAKRIETTDTLNELEALYKPFIEKRNSNAEIARKKGFDVPAELILKGIKEAKTNKKAKPLDLGKVLKSVKGEHAQEEVVSGVKDILKEIVVEDVAIRSDIREEYVKRSYIVSKLKKGGKEIDTLEKFKMYYDFREEVSKLPSHRLLAIKRGEADGVLKVSYEVEKEKIVSNMTRAFAGDVKGLSKEVAEIVTEVVSESFAKSIKGSVEREVTTMLKENSDTQAIDIFSRNLEYLLMTAPVKGHVILGFDPAYRTGCKLAVIDENGKFLDKTVIYPHAPRMDVSGSLKTLDRLADTYKITLIAIGNGTASRESELLISDWIKGRKDGIQYAMVSEAGASVYSASEVARREFPKFSVEERSAVSIARRVLDPLAELIKIDPKAIGVGQYQHDVNQKELGQAVDFTVSKVVNRVGVDLNTASVELLSRVSGLSDKIALNIVAYREENGAFTDRTQLLKVKGLGKKAYEQCAGFLRIYDGKNALDETGIHPEMYGEVKDLLKSVKLTVDKVLRVDDAKRLKAIDKIKKATTDERFVDVIAEFEKPRRDIRSDVGEVLLRSDIMTVDDLKIGDEMKGTVRNVVDFGAFVDIGLKNDGLIHISKLSNKFIKHPSEIVNVGDIVTVVVCTIDEKSGKIGLERLDK